MRFNMHRIYNDLDNFEYTQHKISSIDIIYIIITSVSYELIQVKN